MQRRELRQRLAVLDAAVAQLDTARDDLERQRDPILRELALITYPVLTLPREITTEVFMWFKANTIREDWISTRFAPLVLIRICRAWRDLAFSIQALWEALPGLQLHTSPRVEQRLDEWFAHAGSRPLTLSMWDRTGAAMERILHKHAPRLGRLRLHTGTLDDFVAVPVFPILSQLEIYSNRLINDNVQLFHANGAPALRHLSLTDVSVDWLVHTPWAQLTKLTLESVSLGEALETLRAATALVEFCCRSARKDEESSLSLVHHSSITSFAIDTGEHDLDILPLVTLPLLECLQLGAVADHYAYSTEESMDSTVLQFLERVSTTLHRLILGVETAPLTWILPLAQLTALELLQFDTEIICALDRRTSPETLPKLRTLALWYCPSSRVDDALLGVLGSRCDGDRAHARLESFRLIWEAPTVDDLRDDLDISVGPGDQPLVNILPLRALAARGMHIHIARDP